VDRTKKTSKLEKSLQSANSPSEQRRFSFQQTLDLALQHHIAGDLSKAENIYQQILQTDPNCPDALHFLGVISHQAGKSNRAVDLIKKALTVKPDYAEAHSNLGNILREIRRFGEAVGSYQNALAVKPENTAVHNNLGLVFKELGRFNDAIASYHRALTIEPQSAQVHANLGTVLREVGRLDEAFNSYQSALTIKPDFAEAHNNFGNVLKDLGKLEEAVASYQTALTLKPYFPEAGRKLLLVMLYVSGLSHEEIFTAHLRFSKNHARLISRSEENFTNEPISNRRLRVGYLSSDFRDHPVGYNIQPLLHFYDRGTLEVYCYSDVPRPDAITEKFRYRVDHWHSIIGKSDAEVVRMVRADEIDILICLAGHFDRNRPLFCAHRAAPVQVSYHDATTSGLEEMDYLLTDDFLNPPDTKELFTEELHRLPVFYQWMPIDDAPPVEPLPARQIGFITFGSFNNPSKVNEKVISLWSEVLKTFSTSRLLLKYKNWYDQLSLRHSMVERFAAHGIEEDRVTFAVTLDTFSEHLGHYSNVDIGLDPFPFNGVTTTFQALWMGVPVISLAGQTLRSRTTGSILHHLGLNELVVNTPEAYVACAADLAGNLVRLETLRTTLRERITTSPLCDAPAYAHSVEAAYRDMWRKWCAGPNPPKRETEINARPSM
jgi:predicted O-linked N-acetylglucosamine transferase (SPINDLY family)